MSYDNLFTISYCFGGVNFGTGDKTFRIGVPRFANLGRVVEVSANITTTFTQVTTAGRIRLGVTGALAKFLDMNMGAAAAGTAYNLRDNNGIVYDSDGKPVFWRRAVDNVDELILTCVAPTGGTPAGIADVMVCIGWDQSYNLRYPLV